MKTVNDVEILLKIAHLIGILFLNQMYSFIINKTIKEIKIENRAVHPWETNEMLNKDVTITRDRIRNYILTKKRFGFELRI